jgi:hypothetical protein
MARAQRTSDIMAIQRTISLVAPVAEAVPQILDNYDFDEMARHIARITGLPQKMVKDSDRVQEERQQRAQAQQAQMMAAVAKDAAGAAKTASEIKPSTLQEALG